jgi:deazaflavin-dependent oxidoreductase (nitroreductase family)
MRRLLAVVGVIGLVTAIAEWWRRHPRVGASYVNHVVDPWLLRRGIVAESAGEIGLIEHVGRVSGTVRHTPVHPVATEHGYRMVVPLGDHSEWAANVLAAGHCRLQVNTTIHELDEPTLVVPSRIEAIPRGLARLMEWLGFRYLVLHRYAEHEGTLDAAAGPIAERVADPVATATPEPAPILEPTPEALPAATA